MSFSPSQTSCLTKRLSLCCLYDDGEILNAGRDIHSTLNVSAPFSTAPLQILSFTDRSSKLPRSWTSILSFGDPSCVCKTFSGSCRFRNVTVQGDSPLRRSGRPTRLFSRALTMRAFSIWPKAAFGF